MNNVLAVRSRQEFREWLEKNASKETECYVVIKRGKPTDEKTFWYLDAVEEALCFGWIDSTVRKENGIAYQRFTPRKKDGLWTELNKERVRRLERLGKMTDAGRAVLPDMDKPFCVDKEIERALREANAWEKFLVFSPLYQRVRAYNVAFYKNRDAQAYKKALAHLIEETAKGKTYGNWNDYGRLL